MRIFALLGLSLLLAGPLVAEPIAVIVHPQCPVQELTSEELRAAYEGYGLPGVDSHEIALVYLRGDIEDAFNQAVLGISSKKVKVYWLRRVFEGESDLRKIVKSVAEARAFVAQNTECIGFIPAAELDDSVRAVAIDGTSHTDAGYPLK